ncbi:DUF3042 family protein [Ligilactobacillus faecis]|uniref:DUF3042 family protein n=1 Tax=Ligilactobacillus faecis TaxID=762833 RepID=A0ABV4DRV9_9LACO|nr:DUF3042 family protein [Ligilactobacillus faecis]WGN89246.1 DUF3042 family protein [Ligilactobacillus faecis]
MKSFGKGFLAGALTAFGAVAGCVFAFKKTVVEPIEEREAVLDEHRRRALRKRRSSHQG